MFLRWDDSLDQVFIGNSTEAIWQLQPVAGGFNTFDGYNFILPDAPNPSNPLNSVALTQALSSSFEAHDARRSHWIGQRIAGSDTFYFPFKYKQSYGAGAAAPTEYQMVLRLAEQYLIRAEAAAQLHQWSHALSRFKYDPTPSRTAQLYRIVRSSRRSRSDPAGTPRRTFLRMGPPVV